MADNTEKDKRDQRNGQFVSGRSGNPQGRPRKPRTVDDAILDAVNKPITVTEKGRRKQRSKLEVTAAQIANQGASGNLSAGKMTFDLARRAEERRSLASGTSEELPPPDREIAERFIARLKQMFEEERDHELSTDAE